jgi:hypothetical protein
MTMERERLPRKRYHWVWYCRCGQTLPYSKLTVDRSVFDA